MFALLPTQQKMNNLTFNPHPCQQTAMSGICIQMLLNVDLFIFMKKNTMKNTNFTHGLLN